MASSPRSVEVSVRVYELLIRAYPASFRERYADEMTRLFRRLAADALRQRGAMGLATTWLRVLGDLAWSASQERFCELQEEWEMKTAAFAAFSVFLAAVVHFFVFAAIALTCVTVGLLCSDNVLATLSHPVIEWIMILAPAPVTGLILARAKPFFAPMLTVPLGGMMVGALFALRDGGAPLWSAIGLVAVVGLGSLLGYLMGARLSRRWGRARPGPERNTAESRPAIDVSRSALLLACCVYLAPFLCFLVPNAGLAYTAIFGAWLLLGAVYLRWRLRIALVIHCVGPIAFALLAFPLLVTVEGILPPDADRLSVAATGLIDGCWASIFYGFPVVAMVVLAPRCGRRQGPLAQST